MITFKNFCFKNAVIYNSFEVDLSSSGVVLITGDNRTTGGSNGAGKSLPWSILRNILFGYTERNSKKDDLVKVKDYECYLSLSKDGDDYEFYQYRCHSVYKNRYVILRNKKDITPKGIVESEKFIRNTIGLTEDEFSSSVHLTGNSVHVLIGGNRSDRLNYLSSMFDLSVYDGIREVIKGDFDLVRGKISILDDKTKLYNQFLSERKSINIDVIRNELSELEVKLSKLKHRESMLNRQYVKAQRLADLREKSLSLSKEKSNDLERKIRITKSKIDRLSKEISLLEDKIRNNERYKELESIIKEKQEEKNRIKLIKFYSHPYYVNKYHFWKYYYNYLVNQRSNEDKRCPLCGSSMSYKLFNANLSYSRKMVKNLSSKIDSAKKLESRKKRFDDLDNEIKKLSFKLSSMKYEDGVETECNELKKKKDLLMGRFYRLNNRLSEARLSEDVSNEIDKILGEIGEVSVSDTLRDLEKVRSEMNDVQSKITDVRAAVNRAEMLDLKLKELGEMKEDLDILRRRENLFSFLYKVYSPSGFKLERLKFIVNDLNSNINYYSSFLFSDRKFELSCDTNGIDFFSVSGKGKKFDVQFMSGGEKKRLTISLLMSSREMISPSKKTNLLILDEIDSNMDSVGKDYILRFLIPELRKSVSSVFVITHSYDLHDRGVYDKIWNVVREGDNAFLVKE